ncbi:MAG: 30S ribosomal protein S12 methylthiotransferase RimO [Heliobacteriaceae bacterium]|nr:30S ribosomal protein S12 methylthiotransferase RimO [Heliobacteriaceae bacterium]MDD4587877.1 30S ribosomal protein S12 methylthiotransferase RimO [Heliobacteriaceae bacterium]
MALRVNITSLGCAKNRVDTEVMLGLLRTAGFLVTTRVEEAAVLIVNTCGFITPAKEESIGAILELAQFKETGKCRLLLVGGCLAQGYAPELAADLPEVDGFFGPGEVGDIVRIVREAWQGKRQNRVGPPAYLYDHTTPRVLSTPKHYAYVKITEGCDNRCSYCVIPALRGSLRSRMPDSVAREVQGLVRRGVQEVLLVGQDTTRYGYDQESNAGLADLIPRLAAVPGLKWLRLLYCHPAHFTRRLIEAMAAEAKVCRYVDLPLQHADDEILRQMNRQVTQRQIRELVRELRANLPGIAIRTTFIVGYPGETPAKFQTLLDFLAEMRFDRVGIFTYSREEGTPAGRQKDQIPEAVKEERYHQAMALQQQISYSLQQAWVGREIDVLVEAVLAPGLFRGRSEREAPEVDGHIEFRGKGWRPGQWARVKVTAAGHYDLMGEALNEPGE